MSGITKCNELLLQSASEIKKCDRHCYKVCQVLQILAVVTKRDIIDVNILTDVFVFEEQFKMAGWIFLPQFYIYF